LKPTQKKCVLIISLAVAAMASPLFYSPDAFAEGGVTPGRRLWDNIMLWVNFGILVFFFLKFARKPLMDFLRGARDKIKTELDTISSRLKEVEATRDAEADRLKSIDQRLKEVQQGILEMGRREKEQIIQQGKNAAEKMVVSAKAYSKYRMNLAKKDLSDQMVDIAISVAEERLRKAISEKDNENLNNLFIRHLETSKQDIG
jgi:F-type H+-transporting ATPase subunit b